VARILVIDNYDSFVYNLVQYLGQLGAEPLVYRNDAIDVAAARALQPDGLLVSPGPGRPETAGVSKALIAALAGEVPVLGVCLGHQCIGEVFGAHRGDARQDVVDRARRAGCVRRAAGSAHRHPLSLTGGR
jgi:anthranilate synthase/aminodeoxychorismate synthase-like glutamine amidotransferase